MGNIALGSDATHRAGLGSGGVEGGAGLGRGAMG